MATLDATNPTLMDVAKRLDPQGNIDGIVELLNEQNPILDDVVFLEGNLPTGHRTTIRTGLPSATWRLLNYGVQPSKSTTAQVTDSAGILEAYAEVDKDLAMLNGNTAAFRLSEAKAHLEAMNQEFVDTLFYGNTSTDPEKFMGLSPRYNSLSAANGQNIVDAGSDASGSLTSIWLIVWGSDTCHAFYPKGSVGGLQQKDLGEVTLEDAAGGLYQGFRSWFQWKAGLCLRDWRYVVRIANVETATLTVAPTAGSRTAAGVADLIDVMVEALETVQSLSSGRAVFYANRTVTSFLRRQITNKSTVNLSMDEVAGRKVMTFDGIPVRRTDALLNTEARIT